MEKITERAARRKLALYQLGEGKLTKEDIETFPDKIFQESAPVLTMLEVDSGVWDKLSEELTDNADFVEQAILANPEIYEKLENSWLENAPINYRCAYAASKVKRDISEVERIDARLFKYEGFSGMLTQSVKEYMYSRLEKDAENGCVSVIGIQETLNYADEFLTEKLGQYKAYEESSKRIDKFSFGNNK